MLQHSTYLHSTSAGMLLGCWDHSIYFIIGFRPQHGLSDDVLHNVTGQTVLESTNQPTHINGTQVEVSKTVCTYHTLCPKCAYGINSHWRPSALHQAGAQSRCPTCSADSCS